MGFLFKSSTSLKEINLNLFKSQAYHPRIDKQGHEGVLCKKVSFPPFERYGCSHEASFYETSPPPPPKFWRTCMEQPNKSIG